MSDDIKRIIDGPDDWRLVIDGLARHHRPPETVGFKIEDEGHLNIVITTLTYDWRVHDLFNPRDELRLRDLERAFVSFESNFRNSWWFQGHNRSWRTSLAWGIYNTKTRQGVALTRHTAA